MESPQTDCICTLCGDHHELGGYDCMEEYVGWIEDNTVFESLRERDTIIAGCAWFNDWTKWNACGGLVGTEPNPLPYALRLCRDLDNVEAVIEHCRVCIDPNDMLNRFRSYNVGLRSRLN
jgi:hypothetical protein